MELLMADEDMFLEHIEEFSGLYELCFSQSMDIAEIKWRYLENPNKDILACFAIDNGKLVANYSVSPVELLNNGNIIKAGLSLNTMTHPEYTGRGLFVELATCVYNEMQNRGYELVCGFPNHISNRTFVRKLGWKDIYEIPMLELNLENTKRIKESKYKIVEDHAYIYDYHLCNKKSGKIMVNKTKEYMKWKYAKNPINRYYNFVIRGSSEQVSSRIVCKEYQNRINIVDYFMNNGEESEALLGYVIQWAKSMGKDLVTLWSVLGTQEHLILEKLGFRNNYPVTYFGANIFKEADLDYYKYGNWEIHLSDDNVY